MIRNLGVARIAQIHFKDVNLAVQPPDFTVRLGRGYVRFGAVMFALRSIMYDGWVVLETPPGDKDERILSMHVEDARSIISLGEDNHSAQGQGASNAGH